MAVGAGQMPEHVHHGPTVPRMSGLAIEAGHLGDDLVARPPHPAEGLVPPPEEGLGVAGLMDGRKVRATFGPPERIRDDARALLRHAPSLRGGTPFRSWGRPIVPAWPREARARQDAS